MAARLNAAPVAFLVASRGTAQAELVHAWEAVLATDGRPVLVSRARGEVLLAGEAGDVGMGVDVSIADTDEREYAGLVLPGGDAALAALRLDAAAIGLIRSFFLTGKPVAAVSHAPGVLLTASVLRGRAVTAWPALSGELTAGGAVWRDEPVVVDTNGPNALVTARGPRELPDFCAVFTETIGAARLD